MKVQYQKQTDVLNKEEIEVLPDFEIMKIIPQRIIAHRQHIWNQNIKGASVEVPKNPNKARQKAAQAMFNLYVAEEVIARQDWLLRRLCEIIDKQEKELGKEIKEKQEFEQAINEIWDMYEEKVFNSR